MNFHSAVNNKNTRNINKAQYTSNSYQSMTCKPTQYITPQNCGNEFKKLIKKLAGSKSRKIKKLGAWKKFEFLIKKNCV